MIRRLASLALLASCEGLPNQGGYGGGYDQQVVVIDTGSNVVADINLAEAGLTANMRMARNADQIGRAHV